MGVRRAVSKTLAWSTSSFHSAPSVADASRLHLTVALKPRDPSGLAAYAQAVSTPGSGSYRQYLTPGQFGRRFGATPAAVGRVRAAFARQGLRLGSVAAGRLSIPLVARQDAYVCKYFADEMAFKAADMCMQIHGGIALTTDLPIEKFWRQRRSFRITEGATEVMKMVIARHVLKTYA